MIPRTFKPLVTAVLFGWAALAQAADVKLGVAEALSGGAAQYGQSIRAGFQLAADEINAAGGINGSKLVLVVEDEQGKKEEAINAFKKLIFQGKPVNEETIFHMKREMGDVMWYIMQVLMALDTPIEEIVQMNVEKLQKRYPGGSFDAFYSENRQEGDL